MPGLRVIPIRHRDPSAEYGRDDEFVIGRFTTKTKTTVRGLKRQLAEMIGERTGAALPERLRLYGVSYVRLQPWKYSFHAEEILSGNDDERVLAALKDLNDRGRIESHCTIGMVIEPEAPDDANEDVQVVREVDTVAERIAAGRATAVDVDNDVGSDAEHDADEGAPLAKRSRRECSSAGGGSGDDAGEGRGVEAGQSGGDEGRDAPAGADVEEQEAEEENNDDEVAAAVAAPGVGAGHGVAEESAANPAAAAASPLRLWLRGLEVDGVAPNRFERYAPAFEQEFATIGHLIIVPEEAASYTNSDSLWNDVFRACGVAAIGDKLWLRRGVVELAAVARQQAEA